MRHLKKALSVLLALAMLLGCMGISALAEENCPSKGFSDVPPEGHWAHEGIDFMVKQAIGMAKNRPGGELIEPLEGNRILLALSKNQQAGSVLDHVTLRDIRFDEQYAIIDFVPKSL